ncbi:MAG: hypothetical protein ACTTKH_02010 [Treponema sp.]
MKKIFYFSLYAICLAFGMQNLHSQVVATICIENKHSESLPNYATLYIENKLMDSFFNEGFIVTNLPYIKEEIDSFNSYKKNQYAFDSEPDYLILLYFSYEGRKKYDETRRKNILPCKAIYCKVIKRNSSNILYEKAFELEKILNDSNIYKKLDFCLSMLNEKIVEAIRGSK